MPLVPLEVGYFYSFHTCSNLISSSCRSPAGSSNVALLRHIAKLHEGKALAAAKLDVNNYRTEDRYSAIMVLMSRKVN